MAAGPSFSPPSAETALLPAPPCVAPLDDSEKWFREQVHPHEGLLKRWLRGKFPHVRDIDDLVHDAYIRLWKRHAARPVDSAKAFLFTVAKNLAITRINQARISPLVAIGDLSTLEVLADGPGSAETACRLEETELLHQAIDRLSARTREVYLLRKFEGLAQKEIAEKLGISVKTVEAHISNANKCCERFLRERGVIEDDAP